MKLFLKYSKVRDDIYVDWNTSKYSRCLNVTDRQRQTDGQTDERTDDILWHNRVVKNGKKINVIYAKFDLDVGLVMRNNKKSIIIVCHSFVVD